MARRSGLAAVLARAAREADAAQRRHQREQIQAQRELERQQRATQRAQAQREKEQRRLYLEQRQADVNEQNEDLALRLVDLEGILAATLDHDDYIDFESLKENPTLPQFQPGDLRQPTGQPPLLDAFLPSAPGALRRLIPGSMKKWQMQVEAAHTDFSAAKQAYELAERTRLAKLEEKQQAHEERVASIKKKVASQHAEIDAFRAEFEAGEPDAVVSYFDMVLQASDYPIGFPQHYRIAFVPESKMLVIEYQLPTLEIVPVVKQYRFIKSRDEVTEVAAPQTARKSLYRKIVAQIPLRTLHEVFEADRGSLVETIVFNGYVESIDKGTGQPVTPTIVTLRTTRAVFDELNLRAVEPEACLKHLSASVSKRPEELAPVRPVVEFDTVDSRFVEESDVISSLDTRPNLMDLNPTEFEGLIQNLFERMGLDTKQTRASRDGGVDCIAFDHRPIFGGKVVIQAKRYKNTVGVSAVRDLYGTLQNEGASKGILVTTSGFGASSFEFANNKPIELIDGSNLLYLLAEHADLEARIVPPDDWKDPEPDS